MSSSARKRNSEKRRDEKRKRKLANTMRYTELKGTSKNKKHKGGTKAGKTIPGHPHTSFCGNIGCRKCFPGMNL